MTLMGSIRSQAQSDTCFDDAQIHELNLYRIDCEKDKLDLKDTTDELKDARSNSVSQDHSIIVIIGVVTFLLGTLVGSTMKK